MMDVAASIPVSAGELHYDRRTIEALGPAVAEGMKNLLLRVQTGELKNEPDRLYRAALRFRKRHGHDE